MCPICWINGLIAFLIGMGLLAMDSPYTPFLIGLAMILTGYSLWKFYRGYKMWKGYGDETRKKNWQTIKRFTQGVILGAVIASGVFYAIHWPAIDFYHHNSSKHSVMNHEQHEQSQEKENLISRILRWGH